MNLSCLYNKTHMKTIRVVAAVICDSICEKKKIGKKVIELLEKEGN